MHFISSLFDVPLAQEGQDFLFAYRSNYNGFIIEYPLSCFVSHLFFYYHISVDLQIAFSKFLVAELITEPFLYCLLLVVLYKGRNVEYKAIVL